MQFVKSHKALFYATFKGLVVLRGKPPHPVLGQNPHPLIRLYSGKKGYDKIRILFHKSIRFIKVLPMFFEKLKDLKIRFKSQGLISTL